MMIKNFLACLWSFLLIFLVGEVAVRKMGLVNRLHNRCSNYYSEEIGYLHRPNISSNFWVEGRRVNYSTNTLGFRDFNRYVPKYGRKRVLVLGDSFVESPYTSLAETFPAILEKKTGKEFINLGRMGMGTVTEFNIYKNFSAELNADLVIIAFYINDVANNYYPPAPDWPPVEDPFIAHLKPAASGYQKIPPALLPDRSWLQTTINENFYLYQYIGDTLHNATAKKAAITQTGIESKLFDDPEPREVKAAWETTAYALKQFSLIKPKVLLFYIPPVYHLEPNDKVSKRLAEICQQLGIKYVQLPGMEEEHYYESNLHLNPEGHAHVAEIIEKNI